MTTVEKAVQKPVPVVVRTTSETFTRHEEGEFGATAAIFAILVRRDTFWMSDKTRRHKDSIIDKRVSAVWGPIDDKDGTWKGREGWIAVPKVEAS